MMSSDAKELCLALMHADSEEEVISLLRLAGYWDRPEAWRFYGDYENNYNVIGNQQSRPDAALVEKLVNSVDARLMCECWASGIDPTSQNAPRSIREAVAYFFEPDSQPERDSAGRIINWASSKRTEIAKGITLAATGSRDRNPSISISDVGEGQTPELMPSTLLSLNKSNKLRIPFVQGKFNMGGTGVLKFCGQQNLELIVTRRNPSVPVPPTSRDASDSMWGFTVVRRENPSGNRRSSVYTYLAPLDCDSRAGRGGVLRFESPTMPLFPDGRLAYGKAAESGTLIKLYEYHIVGFSRSHILMKGGLLHRVDLLLPDLALPIRLYECRDFGGHGGSFETNVTGLGNRLEEDKGDNLEHGFPSSSQMQVSGEALVVTIYAFKKDRAETYRRTEGIIFTLNGQTQGMLTADFFRRKKIALGYLSDHILVMVDCSGISGRAREDLFMNSRDRLSNGELRQAIERALEDLLRNHQGLRDLNERRRRQEVEDKLVDSKPLESILESLLKRSPSLSALFLEGTRLSNPFNTIRSKPDEGKFEAKRYPTYFRFRNFPDGKVLQKECHINLRCRVFFDTDAENEYFRRHEHRGRASLFMEGPAARVPVTTYTIDVHNGTATLSMDLPENCQIGDRMVFTLEVTDHSRIDPFKNTFVVSVLAASEPNGPGGKKRPSPKPGDGKRTSPAGISLPHIREVFEPEWTEHGFDKFTAVKIIPNLDTRDGPVVYDFLVNMDNFFLKTELKTGKIETELLRARYRFAMVLVGLALIHDDADKKKAHGQVESTSPSDEDTEVSLEDKVEYVTRALGSVLLPMIESLGNLSLEEVSAMIGDEAV